MPLGWEIPETIVWAPVPSRFDFKMLEFTPVDESGADQ